MLCENFKTFELHFKLNCLIINTNTNLFESIIASGKRKIFKPISVLGPIIIALANIPVLVPYIRVNA